MRRDSILEAIGNTPLVELARMSPRRGVSIFAKLEGHNPAGSLKDRIAKYMIERAEQSGELTPDKTILEATSGNTGIALAMLGCRKGYSVKIVMPDNVSVERRLLLEAYGAEIVLTEGARRVQGSVEVAREMAAKNASYFMPDQFSNPANPLAHYETTAVEILEDLPDLDIDVLVAGLGTGGTIMGIGRRLRERNPKTRLIGVEPPPQDQIQGLRCLAEGFVPAVLDPSFIERAAVTSSHAAQATRELARREGIFAGHSSGAVVHHALKVAQQMERGNIVIVLPDGGWKYLSLGIWKTALG